MNTFSEIKQIISGHRPAIVSPDNLTRTAVALILRENEGAPEILFIVRATHDGDPWSGNIGFPGGRMEQWDSSPHATALRETEEEIGLDLNAQEYVGQLDDVIGAHIPVLVSCFVYTIKNSPGLTLNPEIDRVVWMPVKSLLDPARHIDAEVLFGGATITRPAIDILGQGGPVLWGITYRLIMQLFAVLGLSPTEGPLTGQPSA